MLASLLSRRLCSGSKQQLGGGCWNLLQCLQISVQVKVPPMGDSISEGSISAVLRAAGDSVRENDVIAQVETDKVTIDIKAPSDGKLIGILVKEQDTVVPGQVVATVDNAGTEGAIAQPIAAAAAPPPTESPEAPGAVQSSPAAAPAAAAATARRPGIRFPPRVTPEGVRISSLSAAEAAGWLQRLTQGAAAPQPAAGAGVAAATPTPPPRAAAAAAAPAAPAAAGGSKASSSVRLAQQPSRRELTEEEMEVIMLGGASP